MKNNCNYTSNCKAYMNLCNFCSNNYQNLYEPLPTKMYEPICPKGMKDCILDPAYIKFYHPDWYIELYGNTSPSENLSERCFDEECMYDNEDK